MGRILACVLVLAMCMGYLPLAAAESADGKNGKRVLDSPLAGRWYNADRVRLAAEIDDYLKNVPPGPGLQAWALILPHAGLAWSGQTGAYGIKAVVASGQKIRRVIVIGPSHHVYFKNRASVPDGFSHYRTPLGEMPLDRELIDELRATPYFATEPGADFPEHSVQVMLPMLQRALGDFRLVPIVLGVLDQGAVRAIAGILQPHLDKETLLVVSTDFTHYGAGFDYRPFTEDIEENLKKLDMGAFHLIEARDLTGFAGYIDRTGATICGQVPLMVLLALMPEDARVQLLRYDTSGRLTGDFSSSVSYLSAAVSGERPAAAGGPQDTLSRQDRAGLLALARATVKFTLEKGRKPSPAELGVEITPGMERVMGAFVTLKIKGQLRGCIGEITPVRPLYQAVMARAVDAALHDPRFRPVERQEFEALEFEISALTPSHPVASYRDIVLGRDGMVLHKNGHSAVFLPQVAPEQGWTLEQTLSELAVKAGLGPNDWRQGASFDVFQAIVFGEEH
jgi:AmmeMemoRadiSam system protein B/AmmeMemoRadiSam system protein A